MGRKTLFNDDIVERLCLAHENGASKKLCAEMCGISRETLHSWLRQGREAKSGKKKDFYDKWLISHGKFKMFHLQNITKASEKDWKASKYLLEVSDPDEFVIEKRVNAKQKVDTTGYIKLKHEVKTNTLEEVLSLINKEFK